MWEHRTVSNKEFQTTGRINPNETYVRLMDEVEETVKKAEVEQFAYEAFMDYIPRRGPWEPLPETDMSRPDPRVRYIGPAKAKLLNTNLFLGSTWIEAERFKFERRIMNVSDFLKQKTIINANMWTPKQLFTTQSFFFCSTGDEERMGGSFLTGDSPSDTHIFLGKKDKEFPEWEPILWGLGHRGVVPDSDPLDKCFYPSLMHRNVSFNNRLGWIRYSPAGFGKDANGFLTTRPHTWIWPAVDGNRDTPTAFNLLVNLPDRRLSFGEEGITDVFMTTGKTSMYSLMGMMSSSTVRQMFGAGSEMVPLEFHCIEPGLDEWIARASDEDKYSRLFEVCACLGYILTDPLVGQLGGSSKRRRLIMYPSDQGNLLTCVNASQVADHALKSNYEATVFTKLDQADFMNRVTRRFKAYADLVAASEVAQGARWISQADFHDGEKKVVGPSVHSIMSVRGYDIIDMEEYMNSFDDISSAPDRLMRRIVQSIATNALKTIYPIDLLGESAGSAPYSHIFGAKDDNPLVYYTDIRFLVPTSIDKLRSITGSRGADRGRMREAYTSLTNADPMTSLSIQDLTLPFLADLGNDSWQTGTGIKESEVIIEVTMAVNPARVWRSLLEPTTKEVFDLPKGNKGTAANLWGDIFITNEALHDKMERDNLGHYLKLLKLAYHWSNDESKKIHGLGK
ncbi:MAG TPA: hypothetical protein HA359_07335 [Candidatus Poseidoniaceae archaeon]|nr:MAG TPA: hypothetical protein D7H84_07305 [Candidatus Poseidoniales archaeon]DAC61081.1 MAG TPA: hypothetical protein D7I03_01250 [Candidatus Poseidoniales archaeon]HII24054.1 hypothetical protein [Candidatus Poseidoniaceae archaeon]HII49946.1 hypothetical protein [Candidatus Poseidoniaceae archaeon]|tara:strand:+ start:593 stop:2632 length:2040 start_codon:yes stop_codon:yes gene_type:complete